MKSNTFNELDGKGLRIAVVTSRFNQKLTDALLEDCVNALRISGVAEHDIESFRVPGSFELPVMAAGLAAQKRFNAIVCLGVVIKGETKHDQYIADAVAHGLTTVAIQSHIPVIFGVLTTESHEQAEARSLGEKKKGWEAGMSAVEMGRMLSL